MKITNTEQANQYYKIVNDLIDQYIKKWKINATSLSKYLKPGSNKFESFIIKSGLSDVEGINRIVMDVLEDRKNMQLDGILKFESFKNSISESIISIGQSSIEHEKVLADFYNTSLGHVNPVDNESHSYEINDFGDKVICIIYSKEEISEIKNKLVKDSFESIKKKNIVVDNYTPYIYLGLGEIISEEKFKEAYIQKVTEDKLIEIICKIKGFKFKEEYKNYYIFESYATS